MNADVKCTIVGVLKVAMPAFASLRAEGRSATSVTTININPVSAAAEEPVMV